MCCLFEPLWYYLELKVWAYSMVMLSEVCVFSWPHVVVSNLDEFFALLSLQWDTRVLFEKKIMLDTLIILTAKLQQV